MAYQVIVPKVVQKSLSKLPRKEQLRIVEKIKSLEENPRPSGYKNSKDLKITIVFALVIIALFTL